MSKRRQKYIPAFKYNWLTPFFDAFIRLTTRELAFKSRVAQEARLEKGHRILDLGCGTATLTILIKKMYPQADITGLDGDPRVLEIARAKVARTGLEIRLEQAMAFELPYSDGSFDRVVSSLLLHHLTRENKILTLKEVFRVLRPGGEFLIADFGKPANAVMHLLSLFLQWLEETGDMIRGLLPEMLRGAGFSPVEELAQYATIFGTIRLYRASKPEE